MKKVMLTLGIAAILQACGPSSTQSGTSDDGIKSIDSNGALRDDTSSVASPLTDSSKGEHRVDIQKRDTQ